MSSFRYDPTWHDDRKLYEDGELNDDYPGMFGHVVDNHEIHLSSVNFN